MPYNKACPLWPNTADRFFTDLSLQCMNQKGPHCVSTCLAILTGREPEYFQSRINTQDPVSWSLALTEFGMKLAYCPTDVRKLQFYMPELVVLDDLFTLSYYTPGQPKDLLQDPGPDGWLCGSHVVILHRDQVYDPMKETSYDALSQGCGECHTKRIFRVVPGDHQRGL